MWGRPFFSYGEMSCCSTRFVRSCCSLALVPALFHFFLRGLGGRRPVGSVAAGPSCNVRLPMSLGLHVRLPISLCLVGVVDLPCYPAAQRGRIGGKHSSFSPWRRMGAGGHFENVLVVLPEAGDPRAFLAMAG